MNRSRPERPRRPRPPFRERLLPLLYRRASFAYYRRSERYARYCSRVGKEAITPVPRYAGVLAVYLSQRLPARVVDWFGVGGLMRTAKVGVGALLAIAFCMSPVYRALRVVWRSSRALRTAAAARSQPQDDIVGASRGGT